MRRLVTGLLIAGGLATVLVLVIAWPVVLSPTQIIYGQEILGRHADAYAAIRYFGTGEASALYSQPLTDAIGRLFGRLMPPVAAFNLLVLISFPLTAMATYAFARYLHGSHAAALVAALVFTFAPIRLAHAAYHVDLVQTQWLPLFLLALVALVDRVTLPRFVALAASFAALALATDYGALIGLLLSPVVIGAFWIIRADAGRNLRPLVVPALLLTAIAVTGVYFMATGGIGPFGAPTGWAYPLDEVAFYRARWWSYFTPPISHPLLGRLSYAIFDRGGINLELIEQQTFLGYAFLSLTLAGLALAVTQWTTAWRTTAAIVTIGLVAAAISIEPTSGVCDAAALAPGCLMYRVFPVLRNYGRFAIAVNLMVAIGAGVGAVLLTQVGQTSRTIAAGLLAIGAVEFLPLPARAHDVLPSSAHRWLASQPPLDGRILDCFPGDGGERDVPWLTGQPMTLLNPEFATCNDSQIAGRLQTLGYTHVLVRKRAIASTLPTPLPPVLSIAREFDDATFYDVSGAPPPIVTLSAAGFFPFERTAGESWRWMSPAGQWTVRNTTASTVTAVMQVDLEPIGLSRALTVTLDGQPIETIAVALARQNYEIGPFALTPGDHTIAFAADGAPTRPSDVENSRDRRPLTVSFHNERWVVR